MELTHQNPETIDFVPNSGGGEGIRTLDTREGITVFKTVAFVHSATPPIEDTKHSKAVIRASLESSSHAILNHHGKR